MESKTENRINECISHLDITYSYQLAKQMETHKTNPILGFRTAGSDAEHKTGDFLLYMKNRKFCKMLKFTHPDEGSSTKMDLVYLLHIHSVRETSIRHMPMLLKGEYKWDYQTFY